MTSKWRSINGWSSWNRSDGAHREKRAPIVDKRDEEAFRDFLSKTDAPTEIVDPAKLKPWHRRRIRLAKSKARLAGRGSND